MTIVVECHDTTTLWLLIFCMLPKRNTKTKKTFQVMQNKCIRFCLQVDKMSTISHKEFKDLNLLPAINRFEQCFISTVFKFMNDNCPYYFNGVFKFAPEGNISWRNNFLRLERPFRNINTGQTALSFMGSSFWNQIPEKLKKTDNWNTFKHDLKKHFFNQMTWFLLTLPLLLILLLINITKSSNIIIVTTTVIAIIIILLLWLLVLFLSSIFLLLLFFPSTHYYISTVFIEGPQWK